jgi:hypothetical protein
MQRLVALVAVASLALVGCACNGVSGSNSGITAGPTDYPVCADVVVDLSQIAANGALSGPALTQLQNDDQSVTNPTLKRYAKDVATESFGAEFRLSADLGDMAQVCHQMGLYPTTPKS